MGADLFRRLSWPVLLGLMVMCLGLLASHLLRPHRDWAEGLAPLELAEAVPARFGVWQAVQSGPQMVDPTVEAQLQSLYTQTLNRVYTDGQGHDIMVSLAYGKNQSSWNTAAHRPEFCYSGQGFEIQPAGVVKLEAGGHALDAVNFVASKQGRTEAVTYWVTLADTTALPGMTRKLQQLKFGLQGLIVDGMLVRVSSLGADAADQFGAQARFVKDLEKAMADSVKPRFFGH